MNWYKNISFVRILALLVFVLGVVHVSAQGSAKLDSVKIKVDGKDKAFCVIRSAADLVWFSDTVNNYILEKRWEILMKKIQEDDKTDEFKTEAVALMEAIRQNPELYSKDPEKKALWDKAPYRGYIEATSAAGVDIPFNAIIDADYIDMKDYYFIPIATGSGSAKYKGVFDGNGVTIKNLKIDGSKLKMHFYDVQYGYAADLQNVGMFGVIGPGGVVKNVILDNVDVKATGKFTYWNQSIPQVSIGAIVGWLDGGKIETSFVSGNITSDGKDVGVGGVAGAMKNGASITNCLSEVYVFASGTEKVYVGGIVGVVKGNTTVASCVYDGESLVANPDGNGKGAQGAIVGRIAKDKSTEATMNFDDCYYDSDILSNGVGDLEGSPTVNGETQGVPELNIPENACLLNQGEWGENGCSKSEGIWSNSVNITNNGVSRDEQGNVVYVVTFDANGGSFAGGTKISKTFRNGEVLTGLGIVSPTREGRTFGGWAFSADADAPSTDLGKVYKPKKVYAYWKKRYNITFYANGGKFPDGSTQKEKVFDEGDAIAYAVSEGPVDYSVGIGEKRKDYKFIGWSLSDHATEVGNLGVAPLSDPAVYAVWKESQAVFHTVVFDKGFDRDSSIRVEHGTLLAAPSSPSVNGYQFEGWFKESSGVNPFDFSQPITSDATIYAKWSLVNYTISYNLDGGKNHKDNPVSYNVESPYIKLESPTKVGYDFLGWFIDDSYNTPVDGIEPGQAGNKTFFAKWKEIIYTIEFYASATKVESKGNVDPIRKRYNESVNLLDTMFIAPGYLQDGWSIVDGDETDPKTYNLKQAYTANANVILYPHWTIATYKITYHNLYGAVNTNPGTYTRDTNNVVNFVKPVREGYVFGDWFDADGNKVTKIDKGGYGDMDLYATWTPIVVTVTATGQAVTYDGNPHGAEISIDGCPTGYTCNAVSKTITNVSEGPINAEIVSVTIMHGSVDVTEAFRPNIKYVVNGSVSVEPKPVSFVGVDEEQVYTGEEIKVVTPATAPELLAGHTHNVVHSVSGRDAGNYKGTMTSVDDVKILDANGKDVTANYSFTSSSIVAPSTGLTINPTSEPFTISLADQYIQDVGTPPYAMTNVPATTAKSGVTSYEFQFEGGAWTSDLSSLKKPDVNEAGYPINVRATNPNYAGIATTTAKLVITAKTVITITANSKSQEYNGIALTESGYEHSGTLKPGDSWDDVSVTVAGSITDAGSTSNDVASVVITRAGSDVTYEYAINKISGTLTVTKAPLTITAGNKTEEYNGNPHTNDATVEGLKNNETLTVSASQTVAGSTNIYSYEWGTAKQSNYTIVENLGTLTVTPKPVTITVDAATKLYGNADPVFTGVVNGLVAVNDLGTVSYYRTNPSEKNVGEYPGVITANYTPNHNYTVTVTPAKFTIGKRNVTLTSGTASKVYDGAALTAPVTIDGDGFAPDEGASIKVTGSQTDAGSSANEFTYELKEGTNVANYTISQKVGTLTVNPYTVTVSIKGHTNSYIYNGAEQNVFGYDVTIDKPLYKESYFSFNKSETADSVAKGKNVGTYKMNLAPSLFVNDNANFAVTFNVLADGGLTITQKPIEIAVGASSKIYGYEDPDFRTVVNLSGFVESESVESLFGEGKCQIARTPGESVGTYKVSLTGCPAAVENYTLKVTAASNDFKITKRSVVLTATAQKTYGDKDPTTCTAVLSGFVSGDTATVPSCKFDSRIANGENAGDYLFKASVSVDNVDWGTTVKDNYTVGLGSGTLTIKRKDMTVTVADTTKKYGDSDPETYSLTYAGLVNGDKKNVITVASFSREAGELPGSYKVHANGATVQGNYNVSFVDGTLKIKADHSVIAWWHVGATGKLLEYIEVPVLEKDLKNDGAVRTKIKEAVAKWGITPVHEENPDSTYKVREKTWYKLSSTEYVAAFSSTVKQVEIIVKYGKTKADTIHLDVHVPHISVDSLLTKDINGALTARKIDLPKKNADEDSTYVIAAWKKNADDMYVPVFKGVAKTKRIIAKYGENEGDLVGVNIALAALRDETLRNQAINDCMDSLKIKPSKSGNYWFTEKWKKIAEDEYEAVFEKFDPLKDMMTVVAKYGDKSTDTVMIRVYMNATESSIIKMFSDTLAARNITPSKADDGEYGYTFDGTWSRNSKTKQYEPGFIKSKIVKIVVKYGDDDNDTLHIKVNELDTDSIVEKKIEDVLKAESLMPTKEGDSSYVYVFDKFVQNNMTDVYEPKFVKKDRIFNVDFHLPAEGKLLAKFDGYKYGETKMLPDACIKNDTSWKFKGWYEKPNGLGERYKAIRSTDYGDKDVYPLIQKTLRYDANGKKGEIVVIYSDNAERSIRRALAGVIPEDYTKGKVTYTFSEWKLKDGVYTAKFADLMGFTKKSALQFKVAVNGHALEISGAKVGAKYAVFNVNGTAVSQGIVSNGTQYVELSKPGCYIVRVNNQVQRVNVK